MSELAELRIGFLGGGAMGEALAAGLLEAGVGAAHIRVADPDPQRRAHWAERLGIAAMESNAEAVAGSDAAVLAVKPGLVLPVLSALRKQGTEALTRPLWISIAAGIRLARLETELPAGARVVRAMPNTPALVGAGATAFVANAHAQESDRRVAQALFESVGMAWEAPAEGLLDAVTGLSGSGPAYVFVFLEALADAGVRVGLPREAAYRLALQTVFGAAKLALERGDHPAALKDRVTSPGGTTIAGLACLEAHGFRSALLEAVEAATERSRELAEE